MISKMKNLEQKANNAYPYKTKEDEEQAFSTIQIKTFG